MCRIATGAGKRTLKRLLFHHSPLMPTGRLVFCLDYAGGRSLDGLDLVSHDPMDQTHPWPD